jgi:hypothetical protein
VIQYFVGNGSVQYREFTDTVTKMKTDKMLKDLDPKFWRQHKISHTQFDLSVWIGVLKIYAGDTMPRLKSKPRKLEKVLKEFKNKKLHSGFKKGPLVKSKKQAIAIAYSESKKK